MSIALSVKKHGISLAVANQMDQDNADILPDTRFLCGEERMIAVVSIGSRLFAFVEREENHRRNDFHPPRTGKVMKDYVENRQNPFMA